MNKCTALDWNCSCTSCVSKKVKKALEICEETKTSNLYPVSIVAYKWVDLSKRKSIFSYLVEAKNRDEALGKAYKVYEKYWNDFTIIKFHVGTERIYEADQKE